MSTIHIILHDTDQYTRLFIGDSDIDFFPGEYDSSRSVPFLFISLYYDRSQLWTFDLTAT